jgi:hypothetical protein
MQLKLFVIPVKNLGGAEAEMNGFLRGHRVLAVKKDTLSPFTIQRNGPFARPASGSGYCTTR